MMKRLTISIALCCLIASTASASGQSKQLTGAELKSIVHGNYTISIYGYQIRFNVSKGGSFKATFQGDSDTGKWSVKGNKLCLSFKTWTDGKASCSGIKYDGKKWFTADDGTKFSSP